MPRELSAQAVADFRGRACDVAIRLFAELGREQVTMRMISEELGCSRMTPYRYFEDKDELFAASRAKAFGELAERVQLAFGASSEPLERLESLGSAYMAFAREEPHQYRLVFDLTHASEHEHPELVALVEAHWCRMESMMQAVIDAGYLEGEAAMLLHLFWSAMHGSIALQMTRKLPPSCDSETLSRELIRVIYRGLRAK